MRQLFILLFTLFSINAFSQHVDLQLNYFLDDATINTLTNQDRRIWWLSTDTSTPYYTDQAGTPTPWLMGNFNSFDVTDGVTPFTVNDADVITFNDGNDINFVTGVGQTVTGNIIIDPQL